jgi:hypothetical protein
VHQIESLSDSLEEERESLLDNSKLSPEALNEWKNHPITLMLMIELKKNQLQALDYIVGDGDHCDKYRGIIDTIDQIIEFNPVEDD